jgi:hypothetical protein
LVAVQVYVPESAVSRATMLRAPVEDTVVPPRRQVKVQAGQQVAVQVTDSGSLRTMWTDGARLEGDIVRSLGGTVNEMVYHQRTSTDS